MCTSVAIQVSFAKSTSSYFFKKKKKKIGIFKATKIMWFDHDLFFLTYIDKIQKNICVY